MTYKTQLFPFTFTTEIKSKETGKYIEKEFECQGTAYISRHTGIPTRTIEWRAKQGYIPNAKRMGIGEKKRITYFWLTEQANEYIHLVNSGQIKSGKIQKISAETLQQPSNDEFYEVTK